MNNTVTMNLTDYDILKASERTLRDVVEELSDENARLKEYVLEIYEERIREKTQYSKHNIERKDYEHIFLYDINEIFVELKLLLGYEKAENITVKILDKLHEELKEADRDEE